MVPPDASPVGILQLLRRILSTLIEILRTRAQLAVTEIEEQALRATQLLLLALLILFFLSFAVLLGTLAVVTAFWNSHPVGVLAGCAGLYLLVAAVLGVVLYRGVRTRPRLLAATLAELARDGEEFRPR